MGNLPSSGKPEPLKHYFFTHLTNMNNFTSIVASLAKKRLTKPINRRLVANRPPIFFICVNRLNKFVNRCQRWSSVVKLAENTQTRRKLVLITYNRFLYLLQSCFLRKIWQEITKT